VDATVLFDDAAAVNQDDISVGKHFLKDIRCLHVIHRLSVGRQ
jgi:hypothetical protein